MRTWRVMAEALMVGCEPHAHTVERAAVRGAAAQSSIAARGDLQVFGSAERGWSVVWRKSGVMLHVPANRTTAVWSRGSGMRRVVQRGIA